jgi:hypothetical protein
MQGLLLLLLDYTSFLLLDVPGTCNTFDKLGELLHRLSQPAKLCQDRHRCRCVHRGGNVQDLEGCHRKSIGKTRPNMKTASWLGKQNGI